MPWLLLAFPGVLVAMVAHTAVTRLPYDQGFDFGGHLDYIRYIDARAWLPTADEGWQMYHPPAYYALSAGAYELIHRLGAQVHMAGVGRTVALVGWLAMGAVAVGTVRALGGGWLGALVAATMAWLLPGMAMVGAMVYNETTVDLAVAALLLGLARLAAGKPFGLAIIAVAAPVAALAKFSGLAAVAATLPVLIWVGRDRISRLALALVPGGLATAAYYGRNIWLFGTPTPFNADLFHLRSWDPLGWGHPPGYFTRFDLGGCAALTSFWGGFWKWFWAVDCPTSDLDAGPWLHSMPAWLLLLALATTAFVLGAMGWALLQTSGRPALAALWLIPGVVFASFCLYNLRVPSLTSNKGVYVLAGWPAVVIACGLLVDRLGPRWRPWAYAGVLGWSLAMAWAGGLGSL